MTAGATVSLQYTVSCAGVESDEIALKPWRSAGLERSRLRAKGSSTRGRAARPRVSISSGKQEEPMIVFPTASNG